MISILIGFSVFPMAVYVFGFELFSREWWIFMLYGGTLYFIGLFNKYGH